MCHVIGVWSWDLYDNDASPYISWWLWFILFFYVLAWGIWKRRRQGYLLLNRWSSISSSNSMEVWMRWIVYFLWRNLPSFSSLVDFPTIFTAICSTTKILFSNLQMLLPPLPLSSPLLLCSKLRGWHGSGWPALVLGRGHLTRFKNGSGTGHTPNHGPYLLTRLVCHP